MRARATIVIPLLNQCHSWLRQCLESALKQTESCEIVCVISKRTPADTVALVRQIAKASERFVVRMRERPSFAAALNTGIKAASAPRLGFLLSDDWLEPDAVAVSLGFSSDIVSSGMRMFHADGVTRVAHTDRRLTCEEFERLTTNQQRASYLKYFFLFQREALLAVGGVDESIGNTGPDDHDLIWCLLERGASVSLTGRPLYNCRDHSGERLTMRDREAQIRDLRRILSKHGVHGEEQEAIVRQKSKWYGRPAYEVLGEPKPSKC